MDPKHLAQCPKCLKRIEYLHRFTKWEQSWRFRAEDDQVETDMYSVDDKNDYECPLCGEVLFTDPKKAEKFIQGESSPELKQYSVLLLYPNPTERETYFEWTNAESPEQAVTNVKNEAAKGAEIDPDDFALLGCFEGNVNMLLNSLSDS